MFLFDKVMKDYVSTLWKVLIQEKHIERLSICPDGMKFKYHNNHSSYGNFAQNLI